MIQQDEHTIWKAMEWTLQNGVNLPKSDRDRINEVLDKDDDKRTASDYSLCIRCLDYFKTTVEASRTKATTPDERKMVDSAIAQLDHASKACVEEINRLNRH